MRTYVGFSDIPELSYKNSGSYITDFFVDFNVAFTEDNVRIFAPIIKIYATQKLNQFQSKPITSPQLPITNPPQLVGTTLLKNLSVIDIEYQNLQYRTIYKNDIGTLLFESQYQPIPPSYFTSYDMNEISGRSIFYSAITNDVITL